MTIRIVTDSACDLPAATLLEYGVTVVPLKIRFGDEEFVDREELARLGLTDMVGTSGLLRPFMHGFFMDLRLYTRLKTVAEPIDWDDYLKQKV